MNWLTGWGYCQMINLKYLENLAGNINLEATSDNCKIVTVRSLTTFSRPATSHSRTMMQTHTHH